MHANDFAREGDGGPLASAPPLLRLDGITKRFGGVQALDQASLLLRERGVIHALAGENGSGKSTILRVLSGQVRPDTGEVRIAGRRVDFNEPADALRAGVAMVSQETTVAPDLSVAENVLMGRLPRTRRGIDWVATHRLAADALERVGLDYSTRALVGQLRPDQRQLVEIARAMSGEVRVLILDEPTSSLTDDEVEALFRAVRQLAATGTSTLFVSHRIPEMFELANELTVLRDGRTVAHGAIGSFTVESLVAAMVGHEPSKETPCAPGRPPRPGSAALELNGVSVDGALRDIDLALARGEIVGVAGLLGAGRSELLETSFGLRRPVDGAMRRNGRVYAPRGPRDAVASGVGYLPPERRTQGLVLSMSIADNLMMVATASRWRLARPDRALAARACARASQLVRLKGAVPNRSAGTLSGGNQQKVAIAKWLEVDSEVLLLDEPTRGVDGAAKADIHERLRDAASRGVALLVSSSENSELLGLCDRIIVMFRGRIVASLASGDADDAALARLAAGHL